MIAPIRAALYLRVSTSRQADNDLSIPDQRRQAKGYCTSHGWEIAAEYVEPGFRSPSRDHLAAVGTASSRANRVTTASVVIRRLATEAASCRAYLRDHD